MVRRRRRPLRRATMVGGTVYGAGPSTQRGREQALPVSEAATDQLEQLQGAGVVTQDELDDQMRRLLQGP
jgi:hypothetical protein